MSRIRHIEQGNRRIGFREAGQANSEAVFFFHSLGASSEMWAPQLESFGSDYHVIAMDCRGHGGTTADGTFSIPGCVEDAQAVLDELSVPDVHVVGLSMGGQMAAQLAAVLNGGGARRCRSVVLACTYRTMAGPMADERIAATRNVLRAKTMSDVARSYVDSTVCSHMEERWRTLLLQLIEQVRPEDYLATLEEILRYDAGPALSRVAAPILVLSGRKDPRVSPQQLQILLDAAPHARSVILENAGHLANLEDPLAFDREIRRFWSDLPGI